MYIFIYLFDITKSILKKLNGLACGSFVKSSEFSGVGVKLLTICL